MKFCYFTVFHLYPTAMCFKGYVLACSCFCSYLAMKRKGMGQSEATPAWDSDTRKNGFNSALQFAKISPACQHQWQSIPGEGGGISAAGGEWHRRVSGNACPPGPTPALLKNVWASSLSFDSAQRKLRRATKFDQPFLLPSAA